MHVDKLQSLLAKKRKKEKKEGKENLAKMFIGKDTIITSNTEEAC